MQESRSMNKVNDFILVGDMNECVNHPSILTFMSENGLINVHKHKNQINHNASDNTYKHGSKCIDIVMSTYGVIDYITGCQVTECDEVILNDHRGYLIDIEIERYCETIISEYDKPNRNMLKHTRKSHVKYFNDKVDELLDKIKLQRMVLELEHINSHEAFNMIDNVITEILNKARAAVEGPTRALPFSQTKLEISNQHLYWKLRVKNFKERQ